MKHISDIKIRDAAPHIFTRPFLFVEPNTPMMQIATFLAVGPQIYVDGLLVVNENDKGQGTGPVGRIGCNHIIASLLDSDYPDWLETKASQIMDRTVGALDIDSTLGSALEVFEQTRFAFVPIVASSDKERDGEVGDNTLVVTAALAIRDILPLTAKTNLSTPIKQISSPLLSVDGNTSITDGLSYMIGSGIRNIGINRDDMLIRDGANRGVIEDGGESKLLRIINDRKILEFLLSRNGREVLRKNGIAGLGDISIINHLGMISMAPVKSDTTVSEAAGLLMDIRTPCLILEGNKGEEDTDRYIVTPWDIVMKTLKSESTNIIAN